MNVPRFLEVIVERLPGIGGFLRKRRLYLHYSRFVPPGHFYSPVLSDDDIDQWTVQ